MEWMEPEMCFLSREDKKKKKKKSGKAEVEQHKPSLVKSFVPGLVIEELSKGEPDGTKARAGDIFWYYNNNILSEMRSGEDEIYADLTTTSKIETCLNVLLARQ